MKYRFTARARANLRDIAAHTLATWGPEQCDRYLETIEASFRTLAQDPRRGRPCDHIQPGLFRRQAGRYVVFFRVRPYGIRVIAIVHERMLPELHLTGAEQDEE